MTVCAGRQISDADARLGSGKPLSRPAANEQRRRQARGGRGKLLGHTPPQAAFAAAAPAWRRSWRSAHKSWSRAAAVACRMASCELDGGSLYRPVPAGQGRGPRRHEIFTCGAIGPRVCRRRHADRPIGAGRRRQRMPTARVPWSRCRCLTHSRRRSAPAGRDIPRHGAARPPHRAVAPPRPSVSRTG